MAVGTFALLGFLVYGLASVVGTIASAVSGVESIVEFLGSGLGVLIGLVVAVFLVLLGVILIVHSASQSGPEVNTNTSGVGLPTIEQEPPERAQVPTQSIEQDDQLKARLEECERENRRLTRQLASQKSGLSGGAVTHAEIPDEMVSSKYVRQINFYLDELLALADEGPRLTGWTFEGCTIIGPALVSFTNSTDTDSKVQGSPDTTLYKVDAYGDEAVGVI